MIFRQQHRGTHKHVSTSFAEFLWRCRDTSRRRFSPGLSRHRPLRCQTLHSPGTLSGFFFSVVSSPNNNPRLVTGSGGSLCCLSQVMRRFLTNMDAPNALTRLTPSHTAVGTGTVGCCFRLKLNVSLPDRDGTLSSNLGEKLLPVGSSPPSSQSIVSGSELLMENGPSR